MAHTKRYKKSKSTRKRTMRTNASSSKKHQDLYARNKKRNSIIRNIRMGRSTFNRLGGGYIRKDGYKSQEGGASQFVGSPWTVSNNQTPVTILLRVRSALEPAMFRNLKTDNQLIMAQGGQRNLDLNLPSWVK